MNVRVECRRTKHTHTDEEYGRLEPRLGYVAGTDQFVGMLMVVETEP